MRKWNEIPEIVFENTEIIIVNKPVGLPSQSDHSGDSSLLEIFEFERRQNLHLVNRLDRPVSGAIIIAKSVKAQQLFQNEIKIFKSYLAIVSPVSFEEKWIENYIVRNGKSRKAYIHENPENEGANARMLARKLTSLDRYDVLLINLAKGRFHQIRCQLGHISCPIKGDVKYGARRSNRDRSIDLHAFGIHIPEFKINEYAQINRSDTLWSAISDIELVKSPFNLAFRSEGWEES